MIEFAFNKDDYRIISTLERGKMIITELFIREHHKWKNQFVKDLILPNECVLVSIIRDETIIYPRGDTKIIENDKVLVMTDKKVLTELVSELYGDNSCTFPIVPEVPEQKRMIYHCS